MSHYDNVLDHAEKEILAGRGIKDLRHSLGCFGVCPGCQNEEGSGRSVQKDRGHSPMRQGHFSCGGPGGRIVCRGMRLALLLILMALPLLSCQPGTQGERRSGALRVETTLFPLYDMARSIGRDRVDLHLLLPPGVEAHAFEPRPADIVRIQESDLLVYTGRFMEPWVERILGGLNRQRLMVVDASQGVTLLKGGQGHEGHQDQRGRDGEGGGGGVDPHIWLDFGNALQMVDTIAGAMARKDPPNGDFYRANAEVYKQGLRDLDRRYREALAPCRGKAFVHAGHFTFGYLAHRYGLTYLSAYRGFTADAEPTPKRLAELSSRIRQYGLKAIYYEELLSPKVADTLARETGAALLLLHGAHNVSRDDLGRGVTFVDLMERNLVNLEKGLSCP